MERRIVIAMLSLEHANPYERVERLGPICDLDAHTAGASLLALPTTQYSFYILPLSFGDALVELLVRCRVHISHRIASSAPNRS
jgi:hypothetical protein